MPDLQGRTVFITGVTSGIGEACAIRLRRAGWRVLGTGLTEQACAASSEEQGDVVVQMDLRDSNSILRAVEWLKGKVGDAGLQGLVNNAAVDIPGPLEFLPLESLREQFEVNVFGQLAVIQSTMPLIRQGNGRIVNIGSIDGRAVTPFQGGYGATKHAIEALTDVLRMELSPWRIPVSVVEPGDIATPIWEKSLSTADRMLERLPDRCQELYGPLMKAARATAVSMSKKAKSPDIVARAVQHALTSSRPRPRYLVGGDAHLRLALEVLPARWVDKLIMGFIARGA
ncbi:MAG: SDR family oxidoreductase [Candidatus Hydrogenedentes bacterium]|nr:SDR family oxidoreductase [Candidatus Hydrogenedentota bacterium]